MSNRLGLHEVLVGVLDTKDQAVTRVYFQPPSTVKMSYPCIVYERTRMQLSHANNALYNKRDAYTVTVIDPDPDSPYPNKLLNLPLCAFDRHFTVDNLNHDVFTIYY